MILEYAKIRMLDFQLRMREIARPTLLYMDTDSAIMQLHGERCPYEVMRRAPDMFDFGAGRFLGYEQTGREGVGAAPRRPGLHRLPRAQAEQGRDPRHAD